MWKKPYRYGKSRHVTDIDHDKPADLILGFLLIIYIQYLFLFQTNALYYSKFKEWGEDYPCVQVINDGTSTNQVCWYRTEKNVKTKAYRQCLWDLELTVMWLK